MPLLRRPQSYNSYYPRARPFDEFFLGSPAETFDYVVDPNTSPVYAPSIQSGPQLQPYRSTITGYMHQTPTQPIQNTSAPYSTVGKSLF